MTNNYYRTQLSDAILLLEMKQAMNAQQLQKELQYAFESLKPVNLIKSTIQDMAASSYLISNVWGASLGLISGYLSQKLSTDKSHSFGYKIMGTALQIALANLATIDSDDLKYYGQAILDKIFSNTKPK